MVNWSKDSDGRNLRHGYKADTDVLQRVEYFSGAVHINFVSGLEIA